MAKRKSVDSQAYQTMLPMRPPLRILILFSIGQFGWSLASFAVGNLLVYFYMPPEQGPAMFPSFLFQGPVFGVLTLVGLLSAGGRILDGLVDPLVANWSDRKQSKSGKRRWFMLRGALPFALFGALVFFPLSTLEPLMTFIWLAVVISLYYFFFAVYVIPYNAMIGRIRTYSAGASENQYAGFDRLGAWICRWKQYLRFARQIGKPRKNAFGSFSDRHHLATGASPYLHVDPRCFHQGTTLYTASHRGI